MSAYIVLHNVVTDPAKMQQYVLDGLDATAA